MKNRSVYIARFWTKVARGGANACWPYMRYRFRQGYGQFYVGKAILAHVFAYETKHGEGSSQGFMVCHSCDNPPCCNPKHLFKGTALDNMRDKIAKGRDRAVRGEECSWAKLTTTDVKKIKRQIQTGVVQRKIAKNFAVTPSLITYIKNGKAWGHVSI